MKIVGGKIAEFMLEHSFVGFPQLEKMLHKMYVDASNGAHKVVPKGKYLTSEIKYSKTSLTIRLI